MDIFKHFSFALVLIAVIGLSGCNQQGQDSSQSEPVEHVMERSEETLASDLDNQPLPEIPFEQEPVDELPKHGASSHKVDYQKPGASIRFTHNYEGTSSIGEPEAVKLSFSHGYDSGTLSIQLESQDGLSIADNRSPYAFALSASQTAEIETLLSADSEGKFYLSIFATVVDQNGASISRVFALAVNVGELGQSAKSGLEPIHMSIEKTSTDEKLIMMPAEETISQ